MSWMRWVILLLFAAEACWMAFDGTRALVTGDYVTASSGPYAGQLGPWSGLVKAAGLEPRSTLVKSIYAGYGFLALAMAACFALKLPGSRLGMFILPALGLWYLPVGTIINIIVLILVWRSPG